MRTRAARSPMGLQPGPAFLRSTVAAGLACSITFSMLVAIHLTALPVERCSTHTQLQKNNVVPAGAFFLGVVESFKIKI